ncbi:MAG: carboxymuconolactone decarboxylase family protein [Paracoccaceae bacterium]|nr:carboxymuconolactone decarboxylase family protein [Paracoccaceae bacterium]
MYWQNLLNETMERFNNLSKETPDTFKGFSVMGQAAKKEGHLSEKTKEFIALGIAISTKCESCIGFHMKSLVRLGATREQITEALAMVSFMGGGPAISYSSKALEAFDEFSKNDPH